MSQLKYLVLGAILGGTAVFVGLKYHVVRANDGVYLVPKLESSFAQAYVDIRGFGVSDWNDNRMLAAAIVKAKKDNLLRESAADHIADEMGSILNRLGNAASNATQNWR